jgi:sarcosine oxidase
MKTDYQYIVLGCGGIGSAAAYRLARRAGGEVLGLEQFELGHVHGGSQDHSRIIRLTYHHADYTRLTPHTYKAWSELEAESAVRVVTKTGGIELALKDGSGQQDIEMYAASMDAAGIAYERIGADEVMRRFPQFRFDEEVDALWQADTGIADAAKGNAAHIGMARWYGATILDRCPVESIRPIDGGVDVKTRSGTFTCRNLIVAAGAWVDQVLAHVGRQLAVTVTQEQVTYFATPNLKDFSIGKFPVFLSHGEPAIYGFPIYGEVATKAAIDASGPPVTPRTRTYEADASREKRVEVWLQKYIPGFLGPKLYTKTCLYTMPRDRNFVIDRLPEHPQIIVCNGAGHAYKFAALLGKILCQLAMDGRTEYPVEPFSIRRPAITDPSYPAKFHI